MNRLFIALSIIICFSSCRLLYKDYYSQKISVRNKAIPEDINKHEGTFIFLLADGTKNRGNRIYNKSIIKNTNKYYHGKHVLINSNQLNSDKYSDSTEYRYVFYEENRREGDTIGPSWDYLKDFRKTETIILTPFFIWDRKLNIKYKNPIRKNANFKVIQKHYIINLEKERTKK